MIPPLSESVGKEYKFTELTIFKEGEKEKAIVFLVPN